MACVEIQSTSLAQFEKNAPAWPVLQRHIASRRSIARRSICARRTAASSLDAQSKASLLLELDAKISQFQSALQEILGLDLIAFRTNETRAQTAGFRGGAADETPNSVSPGEKFRVHVHTAQATDSTRLEKVWLESHSGDDMEERHVGGSVDPRRQPPIPSSTSRLAETPSPRRRSSRVPPPSSRTTTSQIPSGASAPSRPIRSLRGRNSPLTASPFASARLSRPLNASPVPAASTSHSLSLRPSACASTLKRASFLSTAAHSRCVSTVHTQAAAEGTSRTEAALPDGAQNQPEAKFHRTAAGDTDPILFSVTPAAAETDAYSIKAVAHSGGRTYESGWHSVGYAGLRPYNQYKPAELQTRKVDVKLAPGLRIGYVMGTGDLVPDAIEGMGVTPTLLTAADLTSGDLSSYNVIVIGIRAYSVRPELAAQPRLDEFVRQGGTLIVQYQSSNFPPRCRCLWVE